MQITGKTLQKLFIILLSAVLSTSLQGCTYISSTVDHSADLVSVEESDASAESIITLADIPAYNGTPYVEINGNKPFFTDEELASAGQSYKSFSQLDALGRCGAAMASIGKDIMPTEPRGSIGMIKPSGWHTVRYDDVIEDKYLYNRCHLLAYELTSENANELNLITGTRYMNVMGMLPFENRTADYVKNTGNHVLYRVTPLFDEDDLVASGVLMEAESVEDEGEGITFCVYCYNVQPGITIDYATGDSRLSSEDNQLQTSTDTVYYIGNTNSHKFHYDWCKGVQSMSPSHRITFTSRKEAVDAGYTPCGLCNP